MPASALAAWGWVTGAHSPAIPLLLLAPVPGAAVQGGADDRASRSAGEGRAPAAAQVRRSRGALPGPRRAQAGPCLRTRLQLPGTRVERARAPGRIRRL